MTAHSPVGRCGRVECSRCGCRSTWPLWSQDCPVQAKPARDMAALSEHYEARKSRDRRDRMPPEERRVEWAVAQRRAREKARIDLTPEQRKRAHRMHLDGMSHGEIAVAIGCPGAWQRVRAYIERWSERLLADAARNRQAYRERCEAAE